MSRDFGDALGAQAIRRSVVYMDNHASTRVDPRVVEAMLPFFTESFANAASTTHSPGRAARDAIEAARATIARGIGAHADEILFTSGATESNNVAIRGVAELPLGKGKHVVSAATEHLAVLDPLKKLVRRGFQVTYVPVLPAADEKAGLVVPDRLAEAIRDDTILVSIMLANNEIGVIQPLAEIGRLCKQRGVLLHTDATQAVGKIPVDVEQLQVDLMSFTAHKMYGPKGIGALYVRHHAPYVLMEPLIYGGGQEAGMRSGTSNVPGIVGFARALELCLEEMPAEAPRLRRQRDALFRGLSESVRGVELNGPALTVPGARLPHNLNVAFPEIDGRALLLGMKHVAASSGSACTSSSPKRSHVLRALGMSDRRIWGSVRFGLGRFNTESDVDYVVRAATDTVAQLRKAAGSSDRNRAAAVRRGSPDPAT